jgi:hypothetical protein
MVSSTALSAVIAFFTPASGFVYMLAVMFGFNIFCGMRADGITIVRCRNFSIRKFQGAAVEFFLYLATSLVIFTVMKLAGDESQSLILVKTVSYVYCYVYLQNGLKNLINAYPRSRGLRIVYHVVRFEFLKALPGHVAEIVERINREENGNKK